VSRVARGDTVRVLISLTTDELAEIDAGAAEVGLDRSSYIRSTLLAYRHRIEVRETEREIRAREASARHRRATKRR
jgi:hypothetical protein